MRDRVNLNRRFEEKLKACGLFASSCLRRKKGLFAKKALRENVLFGRPTERNRCLSESREGCTILQILAQSPFFIGVPNPICGPNY